MGGMVVRSAKVLLAVMAGALSAVLWAPPAQAHNSLTGSSPADGARVGRAPEAVTLTFLARLKPAGTTVTVTGPDGAAAADGTPTIKGNKVTVRLRPGASGSYTVAYQVASVDGHTVKGDIQFTAAAAAGAASDPEPSSAPPPPSAQSPSPAETAGPAGTASQTALDRTAADEQGTAWWPWLLGAMLLAAVGAGGYLVRRRAR